ncbi:membrane protein insertase YidC [Helicobacter valdiviensis]|uniref:Membrane protein insertase YidC n=1 Tax=Helicobacter valdiviensis TaxID=1458358 RepID=A0A2W6MWY2_9HELI|nr:membrane protein insertase YidC [Helicobacter valdiviensis]PZT49024.1 membrane protein insertase YidC [Helicobacter valdiviensis]
MLNKLDNLSSQTRIILAVALALAFFIPYGYFFPSKENNATSINNTQKQATTTPQISTANIVALLNNQNTDSTTNQRQIIATIKAKDFEFEIDRLGRISQSYLKTPKEDASSHKFSLFSEDIASPNNPKPLEIRFSDNILNQKAFNTPYSASSSEIIIKDSPQTLTLTQDLGDFKIEKIITFNSNGSYEVAINLPNNYQYFISPGMRPKVENDTYVFKGVIIKEQDGTITTIEDGEATKQENFNNSAILASVDRYYTTLLFSKNNDLNSVILNNSSEDPMPFISANTPLKLYGYIGPKDYRLLESIYAPLSDVVEYGIITFFAKPLFLLLDYLYNLCGNWGWAIILLTFIVRVVLYPLTYKGMVSMQKLKDLAPKMKELQQKYKGEPQKLQAHMMELYKKHGANPMGGCLPLLLQMPVFFAIYRVLYNAIELKGAEWLLWIEDLSVMDPYFVLPILMGITMYLQQHLTPTTFSDPMQEKIFKFLPLIFTIFFVTFPAGLVLYWFVNNIFSILQQLIINKSLERKKAREIAQHKHTKE